MGYVPTSQDSAINITAHGNSIVAIPGIPPIPPYFRGKGVINLTAYDSYLNGVPNPGNSPFAPFSGNPGNINLNASVVNVGNANSSPLGGTSMVNLQGYYITLISGSIIIPDFFPPSLQIRAGGGVVINTI